MSNVTNYFTTPILNKQRCGPVLASLACLAGLSTAAFADDASIFAPYFRADIGLSSTIHKDGYLLDSVERDELLVDSHTGGRFQIGAGLYLNDYLRTDITVSYRGNMTELGTYFDSDGIPNKPENVFDDGGFETSNLSTMLNIYFEPMGVLGTSTGRFSPYVQAGIGWAHNETDDLYFPLYDLTVFGDTHDDLAWQIGAGTTYDLSDRWKLDLSYRYIDMGEARSGLRYDTAGAPAYIEQEARFDLRAHEVMLGLQYSF